VNGKTILFSTRKETKKTKDSNVAFDVKGSQTFPELSIKKCVYSDFHGVTRVNQKVNE
jgi:hypothetical protein